LLLAKVRMIKSSRMTWAGHVTSMEKSAVHIGSGWGSQKERDH
jgi:hypothetical protein